jgi:ketosteroid isomerase-like protein
MTDTHNILAIARKHLDDIQQGKAGLQLAEYFSENIEQVEYPNRLNVKGATSDFDTLMKRSEKGRHLMKKQEYDIRKEYVFGNTVVLEVTWKGLLSAPVGQIPAGGELKAYFALFLEFENGKIIRQRNYDCFELF